MKSVLNILGIALILALIAGWSMNLIALFSLTLESPLGWIIGRVLGVFVPIIGGVIGYF